MKPQFVQITIVTEDDDDFCDKTCPYVRGLYCVLTQEPLDLFFPAQRHGIVRRKRTEFCKKQRTPTAYRKKHELPLPGITDTVKKEKGNEQ